MKARYPIRKYKTHGKRNYTGLIILAIIILAGIIIIPNRFIKATDQHPREDQARAGICILQISLQRYAVAHDGYYPAAIDDIRKWDPEQIDTFPNNYTNTVANGIAFKQSPFEGEYTYITYAENGKVCGYYLIVYGAKNFKGEDIDKDGTPDHVLLALGSDGSAIPSGHGYGFSNYSQRCTLPPLDELLKAQKDNPQTQSVTSPEEVR
jgi:hypothetical protein